MDLAVLDVPRLSEEHGASRAFPLEDGLPEHDHGMVAVFLRPFALPFPVRYAVPFPLHVVHRLIGLPNITPLSSTMIPFGMPSNGLLPVILAKSPPYFDMPTIA